jgi:hypothetical protein
MSACSRAFPRATTHIANHRVLVDARLQVLEDGWINACHCCAGTLLVGCVNDDGRSEGK